MINNCIDNITNNISCSNYNYYPDFSLKNFIIGGGNEYYIRLTLFIFIIVSLILNIIIISITFCRKKGYFSLSGIITLIFLIDNFLHLSSFMINWVVKNKDTERIIDSDKINIGALLYGNPSNLSICKFQAFCLIFFSFCQDIIINIFFASIYYDEKEKRPLFVILLFFIGLIFPLVITSIFYYLDLFGINERFCHISKYTLKITENNIVEYDIDNEYIGFKIIIFIIRIINFIITFFFIIKGVIKMYKITDKKNKQKDKLKGVLLVSIISFLNLLIKLVFKILCFIDNENEAKLIGPYLIVSSLDSILLPLAFSILYKIYIYFSCCLPIKFDDNIIDADSSLKYDEKGHLLPDDR